MVIDLIELLQENPDVIVELRWEEREFGNFLAIKVRDSLDSSRYGVRIPTSDIRSEFTKHIVINELSRAIKMIRDAKQEEPRGPENPSP